MEPESYQASMTSGTRLASAPHEGQPKVTSSTYGRCGSSAETSWPASVLSSSSDPTHVTWDSSCEHTHNGSGVPQ